MAAIISEAEVAAAIEQAFAERIDEMEESIVDETTNEQKVPTMQCSFEPKNKYVSGVENMNEYVLSYFESLNHMSRRIITEQREVMAEQGNKWDNLSPDEQDKLIDERMVSPKVKKHYYLDDSFSTRKPDWFPVLRLAHGISGSEEPGNFNPRDSITSVTEIHSKDQFSSPWSWETRSQQDLHLLEEGELEEQLKRALEADLETLNTVIVPVEVKTEKQHDSDTDSKDTSISRSLPGSEPLSRKEFLLEGQKFSPSNSTQGSKGSLASTPPKGSKASLISETPPKGSKGSLASDIPPGLNKRNLLSDTPSKGSKTSLASETNSKENRGNPLSDTLPKENHSSVAKETPQKKDASKLNLESEMPQSSAVSKSSSPKEQNDSKEAAPAETKEVDIGTASNSNDLLAFLVNW
ncbi:uncharacterized protein C1orf198 homolog [Pocillopora verrucosa]|uniref:uncharacterized protein C1orf198 homolog n=1 Tax=Pocillopora verrucosa TaxID=203993 RepID=UPI003340E6B3